ncbi:MAG: hypothetical protein IPN76_02945 [Saprospiraceae bacterium]|nr:hypothetical protein [Saprospiraceae bacterium]
MAQIGSLLTLVIMLMHQDFRNLPSFWEFSLLLDLVGHWVLHLSEKLIDVGSEKVVFGELEDLQQVIQLFFKISYNHL